MWRKIITTAFDAATSIILSLGIVFLLLPLALHLGLGADNDVYLVIAEGGGKKPIVLVELGLEPMFRASFLLWPALLIIIGFGLRRLLWPWLSKPLARQEDFYSE